MGFIRWAPALATVLACRIAGAGPMQPPAVQTALEALQRRGALLGASGRNAPAVRLVRLDPDRPRLGGWDLSAELAPLRPWQRGQGYAIRRTSGQAPEVAALAPEGLAFGLAHLTGLLRAAPGGGATFDLPPEARLFEAPAIEERGEYLNIGYDIPPITPHTWDAARWRAYIDQLALARLNRFYFFLWGSDVTAWPGSRLSRTETSRRLYRELPGAIRYAQRRGFKVVLMLGPTLIPRDVYDLHPDWHADIEYARHGFPVACPNHPEAWKAITGALRAQLERLRAVDAVQVWFYDPGGCWCEARGCGRGQAASLALQVREFARLFRRVNPRGGLEVNLWPIALWERERKVEVRKPLVQALRRDFRSSWRGITMVGTAEEGPTPTPRWEKEQGFRTGLFLFAANPESGYSFLTPHLRYVPWSARVARDFGVDACFGHRLEAWTRLPATALMAQWLWSPDLEPAEAVRRLSCGLMGDGRAGAALARAILLLDRITDEGAAPELAGPLRAAAAEAWPLAAPGLLKEIEYLPAMLEAVAAIAETAGAAPEALARCEARFAEALHRSPTFASLAADAPGTFRRYREMLLPGWRNRMF